MVKMIPRILQERVLEVAKEFPIVTLTGPRQSGKSTLCKHLFADRPYVTLESPDNRQWASHDPREFLHEHREGAVLDEVQRVPEILSYLQEEVDERPRPGRFILTGSANFTVMEQIGQSLAGRTATLNLLPLSWEEIESTGAEPEDMFQALFRGGYPALHKSKGRVSPRNWLGAYVETYLQKDLGQFVKVNDPAAFQTFLKLCAGNAAQLTNLQRLGNDAGVVHATIKRWLSVLEAGYLTFRITPWHDNIRKQVKKAPKLAFHDTGLLCRLLGIEEPRQLLHHPLRGPVFENWVITEILKFRQQRAADSSLYFYQDRTLEVDLVIRSADGRFVLVEAKSASTLAPDFFTGLNKLQQIMKLDDSQCTKVLIYGGDQRTRRSGVLVFPWNAIHKFDWTLGQES